MTTVAAREIAEIQQHFPSSLRELIDLQPVVEERIGAHVRDLLEVASPVYLPVFVDGGQNVLAVHRSPGVPWQRSKWFRIEHDSVKPQFMASHLGRVPGGLFLLYKSFGARELWTSVCEFAGRLPGGVVPSPRLFAEPEAPEMQIRPVIDPDDVDARVCAVCDDRVVEGDRIAGLIELHDRFPDDVLAMMAGACALSALDRPASREVAMRCLSSEFPAAFTWYLPRPIGCGDSLLGVFVRLREIARHGIAEGSICSPFLSHFITGDVADDAFFAASEDAARNGEHAAALSFIRNGVAVAIEGGKPSDRWLACLLDRTRRLEAASVCVELVEHAIQEFA